MKKRRKKSNISNKYTLVIFYPSKKMSRDERESVKKEKLKKKRNKKVNEKTNKHWNRETEKWMEWVTRKGEIEKWMK